MSWFGSRPSSCNLGWHVHDLVTRVVCVACVRIVASLCAHVRVYARVSPIVAHRVDWSTWFSRGGRASTASWYNILLLRCSATEPCLQTWAICVVGVAAGVGVATGDKFRGRIVDLNLWENSAPRVFEWQLRCALVRARTSTRVHFKLGLIGDSRTLHPTPYPRLGANVLGTSCF